MALVILAVAAIWENLFKMASAHISLDAAATERKLRLAKLKSLKRKQPESYSEIEPPQANSRDLPQAFGLSNTSTQTLIEASDPPSVTTTYLSGRNYDPTTRGPKLGFEAAPTEDQETLEDRATQIAQETHVLAEQEEREEKPIDLFKLQPKKPNWDLKRDLEKKMERLNTRTDNAIARLVRERVETAKRKAGAQGERGVVGEEVGMKGEELVQGVHVREKEEEEDERKEREEDEELV